MPEAIILHDYITMVQALRGISLAVVHSSVFEACKQEGWLMINNWQIAKPKLLHMPRFKIGFVKGITLDKPQVCILYQRCFVMCHPVASDLW